MIIAVSVFNTVAIIYLVINHFSNAPVFDKNAVELQYGANSQEPVHTNDSVQSPVITSTDYLSKTRASKTSPAHAYINQLTIADSLYRDKRYSQARAAYAEAAKLNSNYSYPVDMISLIDLLIADSNEDEPKPETTLPPPDSGESSRVPSGDDTLSRGDYHIVAGVFSSTKNAQKMMDSIRKTGIAPAIEPYGTSGLFVVIYGSFNTENEAEEQLFEVRKSITKDAWIMHKSLK